MDPITLVLNALAAGASSALQQTASTAVSDAYQALKSLLQKKFGNQPKAQTALIDYEEDPETYEKPLRKALSSVQLDRDEHLLAMARQLLTLTQSQQTTVGHTVIQNQGPVQGQVGENSGQITMNFGATPHEQ